MKFNSSPLNNGGWKAILSFGEDNLFRGELLNFERVSDGNLPNQYG